MEKIIVKKNIQKFAKYLIPFSLGAVLLKLWEVEFNLKVLILSSLVFFVYFYLLHTKLESKFKYSLYNLVLLFAGIVTPMLMVVKLEGMSQNWFVATTMVFIIISYVCIRKPNLDRNALLVFGSFLLYSIILAALFMLAIGFMPYDLGQFTKLGLVSLFDGCLLAGLVVIKIVYDSVADKLAFFK
jgi:membrane-associated HD superfamily phosphohydrolase